MFVLIEKVRRPYEGEDTFIMGCYDTMEMAKKSMIALGREVDNVDTIEYDIQSVPLNLEFTDVE